jgi:hypothetical protein
MKKPLFWMIFFLTGMIMMGVTSQKVGAHVHFESPSAQQYSPAQLPEITTMPTATPSIILIQTPDDRVMPAVGSNAGLVLGASLLVLIIIGGVLGSRKRAKH